MPARFLADLAGVQLTAQPLEQLAILPLGSVEYHGPHGALGTDLFLADVIARRVGDALQALVLPTMPFAHCPPTTRGYPGTIDVAEETVARYLHDVLASCFRFGVRGILVLNAHDGNIRPVQTAVDRLADGFPDRYVLLVNWWESVPASVMDSLGFFSQGGGHGHGGPLEISAAAAARPGTVAWEAAHDLDLTAGPGGGVVRALTEGRPPRQWQGYHGRASEGSAEKGERILELAVERIAARTREWLDDLASSDRPSHPEAAPAINEPG